MQYYFPHWVLMRLHIRMREDICKEIRRESFSWMGLQTSPRKNPTISSSTTNVEGREVRNISGYRSILDYNQMALPGVRRHNPREETHLLAEGV